MCGKSPRNFEHCARSSVEERWISNPLVRGSNPFGRATLSHYHWTAIFKAFQLLGLVKRNRRIGRHGDEDDLFVVEAVPEPEISTSDTTDPSAAEGMALRFVVRWSW
jgi:hypothetical protein